MTSHMPLLQRHHVASPLIGDDVISTVRPLGKFVFTVNFEDLYLFLLQILHRKVRRLSKEQKSPDTLYFLVTKRGLRISPYECSVPRIHSHGHISLTVLVMEETFSRETNGSLFRILLFGAWTSGYCPGGGRSLKCRTFFQAYPREKRQVGMGAQ